MKTDYGWYAGGNGTNSSGFSGLPGGNRITIGYFNSAGTSGYWWSSSPYNSLSRYRLLLYFDEDVSSLNYPQGYGFSVRCVRDAE